MATLDIYPPVALYVAGRFSHLPRKGHIEDYAIAMHLDEDSLMEYAVERALFSPGDVIRGCDLQMALSDDVESYVDRLEEKSGQVRTYIERIAHAYKLGLPCNIFLG